MTERKRYFLSYSEPDLAWAHWVAWLVEALGHEVRYQARDCRAGHNFLDWMNEQARAADATLALLSPDSARSKFCRIEWWSELVDDPDGSQRRFIPIRVRAVELEPLLKSHVYIDLVGKREQEAQRLIRSALSEKAEAPDGSSPPPFPNAPAPAPSGFPGSADDLADYRRWALEHHGCVKMVGLGAGHFEPDFEEIYVPLRLSARGELRLESRAFGVDGPLESGDFSIEHAARLACERKHGRGLVVLGEPGSGKTTALRKLLHVALTEGGGALGLSPATVPVFLRCRRITSADLDHSIAARIDKELAELAPGTFTRGLGETLWTRGDLLLLFDGLDEVKDDGLRAAIVRYVQQRLEGHRQRGCVAVISCRYSGYGEPVHFGGRFLHVDLRPLNASLVRAVAHTWFRVARRAQSPNSAGWPALDAKARTEADALADRLDSPELSSQRLLELVSTPLLLTLLCIVVVQGGDVPKRRTEFYERCLGVLLRRPRHERDAPSLLDPDRALDLLMPLAWELHRAGRRDDLTPADFERITRAQRQRIERAVSSPLDAAELLRWLHRDAGVLEEYAPDLFGFAHLGLQEHLAARHVAKRGGKALEQLAASFGDEWWQEVTLLLLGLPGYSVFAPFMEQVARSERLVPHAELLRRALDDSYEIVPTPFVETVEDDSVDPAAKAAILRAFLGRKETALAEAALPLVEHANADLAALARRLAEEADVPLPEAVLARDRARAAESEGTRAAEPTRAQVFTEPFTGIRFLPVPGGTFEMGAADVPYASPVHRVRVSPFLLAETPVTNAQYRVFLEATYNEPAYWRDRRLSAPDQPVVGVSWLDAMAFCVWLSEHSAFLVELPTEAQWERAARGDDGRRFPWGNEAPDRTRAVYAFGDDSQPAPVGSVPAGAGPFGHLDLAGNVWEWCQDEWDEHAYAKRQCDVVVNPVAGDVDARVAAVRVSGIINRMQSAVGIQERADEIWDRAPTWRVLRGGAFWDPGVHLRSASRRRDVATRRNVNFGFRVATSLRARGLLAVRADEVRRL